MSLTWWRFFIGGNMYKTFNDVLIDIRKYNDFHDELGRFARKGTGKSNSALSPSSKEYKQKQLDIIRENNPAPDDYHTWVRETGDIKTFEEAYDEACSEGGDYDCGDNFDPDWTKAMAKDAIKTGKITVYSSYKIGPGVFVTPSKMEAEGYGATGDCNRMAVNIEDVAWIDPIQGQYAKIT